MKWIGGLNRRLRRSFLLGLAVLVSACSSLPTGPERLELVDRLVEEQEFAEARQLLADVDSSDPEFEALKLRRKAIGPLIQQFEENTLRRLEGLKEADDWSAAQTLLEESLEKLPVSEALHNAQDRFHADRAARLAEIDREMNLLRGEHLAAKTRLIEQAAEVHPSSLKSRWQAFRHGREAEALAEELVDCGVRALDESRFDLAESCLNIAAGLTTEDATASHLARLEEERREAEARTAARAKAEQEAAQAARQAKKTEQVEQLKARYRRLFDAGWWAVAKQILTELESQVPEDEDVVAWSEELQVIIGKRVAAAIERGQALYSDGELHRALGVWRRAAQLAPDNSVLQAHIARVERFIAKLERLDQDES